MARSAADHLRDVLEAIAAIRSYTAKGKREFAHKHSTMDTDIVWAVVAKELPRLLAATRALLAKSPSK